MKRKKNKCFWIRNIIRIFLQFFNYSQQFPNLRYSEELTGEELNEVFKNRRSNIQGIRDELKGFSELTDIELMQIWNLGPESSDEALAWIPSLERLIPEGKELFIHQAIDIVRKHKTID